MALPPQYPRLPILPMGDMLHTTTSPLSYSVLKHGKLGDLPPAAGVKILKYWARCLAHGRAVA